MQVKQNVQRTLAIELQKLSVQFRKQQKVFLKKLSQKDGVTLSPSSLSVLDDNGPSNRGGGEDEYDRGGFSDMQVKNPPPPFPPLLPQFLFPHPLTSKLLFLAIALQSSLSELHDSGPFSVKGGRGGGPRLLGHAG